VRRISELTNDDFFEDNNNPSNNDNNVFFDLHQEYENAVNCLKSAESMMKTLQHNLLTKVEELVTKDKQLADKDAQLATKDTQLTKKDAQLDSKDKHIECLEKKMVQMSTELASTNMMKDELEYELWKTSVVRCSKEGGKNDRQVSGSSSDDDVVDFVDDVVVSSEAMAIRLAKYRPRSICNNGKKRIHIQEDDIHRSSQNSQNSNNGNSSSSCLGLQKPKPSLLVRKTYFTLVRRR